MTGVAGFLGSHVAQTLKDAGYTVIGCDNLLTGAIRNLPFQMEFWDDAVQEVPKPRDVDLVVHCAAIPRSTWPNEEELWEHNVRATKSVLDWGLPVIYASSSTAGNPTNVYGRTKLVAERMVLGHGGTALRFCNIYGPGQSEDASVTTPNVLAAFREQRRRLGHVVVEGDGSKTRHWIHVSDAARAVLLAIHHKPRMWLDICGEVRSIGQLASVFGEVKHVDDRPNDPQHMPQDPSPAKWILGWEAQITLDEGISDVA